jgi:hypothetical protein
MSPVLGSISVIPKKPVNLRCLNKVCLCMAASFEPLWGVLGCPGGRCTVVVVGLFQVMRTVLCSFCTSTLAVIVIILVVN